MIQAYHGIFTAYGFWLPNDPRGSWSDFVGSWKRYVEQNPVKEGKRLQRWPFVVPWAPLSASHSRHECRG